MRGFADAATSDFENIGDTLEFDIHILSMYIEQRYVSQRKIKRTKKVFTRKEVEPDLGKSELL